MGRTNYANKIKRLFEGKLPKKEVRLLAYTALERDDMDEVEGASEAFDRFVNGTMDEGEMRDWAYRQIEYKMLVD